MKLNANIKKLLRASIELSSGSLKLINQSMQIETRSWLLVGGIT